MKNYQNGLSMRSIVKSLKNSFRGVRLLLRFEYNLYIQIGFAVMVTLMGLFFSISLMEWAIQCTIIGLVIFSELVNTAFEKTMDLVHPKYDERVRDIKDLASGMVLFMVCAALAVGLFIYVPKIILFFS